MNAIDLVSLLKENRIELSVVDGKLRFQAPQGFATPELLALLKEHKQEIIGHLASTDATRDELTPRPPGPSAPLSFAQQRLWFLHQMDPHAATYNVPTAVRLNGELDRHALACTLNEVVRRHESLRTRFDVVDDVPVQVIGRDSELKLTLVDLSGMAPAERDARARALAEQEEQMPFDLSTGPLVRACLVRLDSDAHIVLLTLHHIVSDGWSMGVLIDEVAALYTAFRDGRPSPLAPLAIQYADYAHWQRQWLRGDVLHRQLAYWKQQLGGAPSLLTLPTDRPRPTVRRSRGDTFGFVIEPELTAGLNALGRRQRATLFMVLAAAFNVLLSRHAAQQDVSIGIPIANRTRTELEPLIGFFVNTLTLRTQVDGKASFEALLEQVRRKALAAYAHQDVPFEQLVEELRPQRQLSYTPLFQVTFALQNAPSESLALPGLTLEPLAGENRTAKFDLELNIEEHGDTLVGHFGYDVDLFDAT
uniref:condensation domain-containing protein n=1 Tax=Caballeronia sp. dw_276 TaxID=2719795 RepID=UPI002105C5A7